MKHGVEADLWGEKCELKDWAGCSPPTDSGGMLQTFYRIERLPKTAADARAGEREEWVSNFESDSFGDKCKNYIVCTYPHSRILSIIYGV